MLRAKNGSSTKIGVVWQKSDFWTKNRNFGPKKKESLLYSNHVLAQLGDLPHLDLLRDEPQNEVLTPICTKKIFNVAVVVGGDHPPQN